MYRIVYLPQLVVQETMLTFITWIITRLANLYISGLQIWNDYNSCLYTGIEIIITFFIIPLAIHCSEMPLLLVLDKNSIGQAKRDMIIICLFNSVAWSLGLI